MHCDTRTQVVLGALNYTMHTDARSEEVDNAARIFASNEPLQARIMSGVLTIMHRKSAHASNGKRKIIVSGGSTSGHGGSGGGGASEKGSCCKGKAGKEGGPEPWKVLGSLHGSKLLITTNNLSLGAAAANSGTGECASFIACQDVASSD
jgi:hypothetical protein